MRDIALAAARAGARVLTDGGLRLRDADRKQLAGDYVTAFDHASEEAILEVLARESPGVPVLAEERGGRRSGTMWTVDPLDGTSNFVRGIPAVGVSVALLHERRPTVGVILAPWLDLEFVAEQGHGATLNGQALGPLGDVPLDRAVVATGFPFRRKERLPRYEAVIGPAIRRFEDLRRIGAASLDLAWTASASLDGFFELGLGTWDLAAGAALILEVGGRVSDWQGGDAYIETGDILAGSPAVHEALLELASQAPQG